MKHPHLITAAVLALLSGSGHALETTWLGASNQLPDQVDPAWNLIDEGGGSPSFAGGVLTIQTTGGHAARQFYTMRNTDISTADGAPYWMEAEMKYVSGTQTGGWWRAAGHMSFGFANGVHAILEIRQDQIYIRNGDNSIGATAVVDTDGAFHTYRMETSSTQSGGILNVYQDGLLVLSDNALYNTGGVASVSWGEASTLASGTTEWKRVSHNIAAVAVTSVPEPGTWAMLTLGMAVVGLARRRRLG